MQGSKSATKGRRLRSLGLRTVSRILPVVALLLSACTVPEHMEVRSGTDPRNQDDDVRFRTTYYFRVFDVCPAAKDGSQADRRVPDTDSLYRFRMTGKASALFVKVHFESGTLKSYEIDPFGAAVVFNPSTGRYQYKSQRQLEEEAAREAAYGQLA